MKVLCSIKHYELSVVFHHSRIECSRGFESIALRRNDRFFGEPIPFPKRHLELSGRRGSDHCESYYNATSSCASQSVLHRVLPLLLFWARAATRCIVVAFT